MLAFVEADEPLVRDGNTVRVARDRPASPSPWRSGWHELLQRFFRWRKDGAETPAGGETCLSAEEAGFAMPNSASSRVRTAGGTTPRARAPAAGEGGTRRDPPRAVQRDATAGHDHVHMRVVGER